MHTNRSGVHKVCIPVSYPMETYGFRQAKYAFVAD